MISLVIKIPHLKIAPLVGNLKVGNLEGWDWCFTITHWNHYWVLSATSGGLIEWKQSTKLRWFAFLIWNCEFPRGKINFFHRYHRWLQKLAIFAILSWQVINTELKVGENLIPKIMTLQLLQQRQQQWPQQQSLQHQRLDKNKVIWRSPCCGWGYVSPARDSILFLWKSSKRSSLCYYIRKHASVKSPFPWHSVLPLSSTFKVFYLLMWKKYGPASLTMKILKHEIDWSKDAHFPTCVASWPAITSVDYHRTKLCL